MKNEKHLTIQQLSLYLGCECRVEKGIGRLTAIDIDRMPTVILAVDGGIPTRQFVAPERIQLVLLPLSEVTIDQLSIIANKHEYDEKYIRRFIDIPELEDIGTEDDFVRHEEDFRTAVWVLNELRALGYDCDDLIPQGLAIDKTKI